MSTKIIEKNMNVPVTSKVGAGKGAMNKLSVLCDKILDKIDRFIAKNQGLIWVGQINGFNLYTVKTPEKDVMTIKENQSLVRTEPSSYEIMMALAKCKPSMSIESAIQLFKLHEM